MIFEPSSTESGLPDTGGRLIYAIGDVHGRDDLLARVLDRIGDDLQSRAAEYPDPPVLVMLGDYIDRGRQSPQVLDRLVRLGAEGPFELRLLLGNHEEAMLDFLAGETSGRGWARYGGRTTMESYGVTVPTNDHDVDGWNAAREAFAATVPSSHLDLLKSMELFVLYGKTLFVHAGIRPGVPLDQQARGDLLGIRKEFLNAEYDFDHFVVHGHTPVERSDLQAGRLNLDTGAYMTGMLSAARLDGGSPAILTSAMAAGDVVRV